MTIQKVLLVDDDPSIRRIGEICLSKVGGWHVMVAASALEALDILNDFQPDVILLDVMMPQWDGITAFPSFVEKTEGKTPIIFMTAKVMKHELARYTELGAAGVVAKPFEPMLLPKEVQAIVGSFLRTQMELPSPCVA